MSSTVKEQSQNLVVDLTENDDNDSGHDSQNEEDLEVIDVKVNRVFSCKVCFQVFNGIIEFRSHFVENHGKDDKRACIPPNREAPVPATPAQFSHLTKRPCQEQRDGNEQDASSTIPKKAKISLSLANRDASEESESHEEDEEWEEPENGRADPSHSPQIVPQPQLQQGSLELAKIKQPTTSLCCSEENAQDLRKCSGSFGPKISLANFKNATTSFDDFDTESSSDDEEQENYERNSPPSSPRPKPKQCNDTRSGSTDTSTSTDSFPETIPRYSGVKISLFGISKSSSSRKETETSSDLHQHLQSDQTNCTDSLPTPVATFSGTQVSAPETSPMAHEPDSTTTCEKQERVNQEAPEQQTAPRIHWVCRRCPFQFPTPESLESHFLQEHYRASASAADGRNKQVTDIDNDDVLKKGRRRNRRGGKKPTKMYCVCHRGSYGDMIACDNKLCEMKWFHYDCVDIVLPPSGKWYCPLCRLL